MSNVRPHMSTQPSPEILRRYTDLPALLYLLRHKKITLLDPKTWDDTNDSYYLLKYKEKRQLKTVLALCLTEAEETYHHWRVFSHGSAGVCIHFDRPAIHAALSAVRGMTIRNIDYRKVREARKSTKPLRIEELPFVKRAGFIAEAEIRAVYESKTKTVSYLDVPFALGSIVKISLSPWLNKRLSNSVKNAVYAIPDCADLDVTRSTLVGNSEWKRLGDGAA
jgi:hypothetical protein